MTAEVLIRKSKILQIFRKKGHIFPASKDSPRATGEITKKGLQVLYSQPFSFVIRIVLYVLRFPDAAAIYHRRLGLLLLCRWYIAVVAIVGNLPGTIGLPFADGQVFTIRH